MYEIIILGASLAHALSGNNSGQKGQTQELKGLTDDDVDRIIAGLSKRLPGSFQYFDFIVGVLLGIAVFLGFYYTAKRRHAWRTQQKDAVEILKGMDDETIKRMLGESNLPSWVNFPDFERVQWVNEVLSQLWPFINSGVSQQFREILGPLLRQNKPSWIASIKLFRFDLGDAAPEANGIKVYKGGESSGEILIELDFSWVGNQDVQLTIKPIPKHLGPLSPAGQLLSSIISLRAGIERIIVNGRLRLIWKPLLGELPIVGGMQAALVEMPKFSFDVTLYGGEASMIPGLEQWLTVFMKDTVFRPYILPERYSTAFTEDTEAEEMRPKAILFLKIIEAKRVPKMDLFSQSDPYVRLSVRHAMQMRTSTKQNNANPSWNEEFKLIVHDTETQVLTCILMDFDDFNPDDEIGRCTVELKGLESGKTQDLWLTIDTESFAESTDGQASNSKEVQGAGFISKIVKAEQKIAEQGERIWKHLPGIDAKDKHCQLHIQATVYDLDSKDFDGLLREGEAARDAGGQKAANASDPRPTASTGDQGHSPKDSRSRMDSEPVTTEDNDGLEDDDRKAVCRGAKEVGKEDSGKDDSAKDDSAEGDITKDSSKVVESEDIREQALDAIKGGVLYVKPRKADGLVHKPWYKGSFLKSSAALEVSVCGQNKSTASARGSNPVFSETLEFLLGGHDVESAEHERVKIEVWDHRLHLNHFRGGCSIILKDVLNSQRIKNTFRLTGVRHGDLSVELFWMPALETAGKQHKPMQLKSAQS